MDAKDSSLSYEDVRKLRLEENKKRMQELGLTDLSKTLASSFSPKSPSASSRQVKPRALKETIFIELRRSSRVANNPQPDYREVEIDISLGRRSYARSSLFARKYASDVARLEAALSAESVQKALPVDNPSFVKPMLQSHVTGGFWLGLPSVFSKTYLPRRDDMIVLEDEKGEEWQTVYLANKTGLSGGWRGFSLDHGLVDGNALVFELVEPRRFEVHIVRACEPETEGKHINEEATHEKTEHEAGKKGTKRKQHLLTEDEDVEKENVNSVEGEAKLRQATAKKLHQVKDKDKKHERSAAERERDAEKCCDKEVKEQGEKIEDTPKNVKKDSKNANIKTRQLTGFLRSKKPSTSTSSFNRASKKAMPTRGDVIEVY